MKQQTVLPTRIPSSKLRSQEGKKNSHSLFSQYLLVILVVALAFAAYFTAKSLPWEAILNLAAANARPHPAVYDATGVMNQAIVYPNQVKQSASRPLPYDATGAMLAAITPQKPLAIRHVYDATGAMLAAIAPQKPLAIRHVYDATGVMLAAITPQKPAAIRPVYDATGAMLDAIVWP